MKKIDRIILQETAYVACGTLVLSMLMEAVFLIIGKWNITVLFGNLLGAVAAVGNFFLMGLTVQSSVGREEKSIQTRVRFSLIFRELLLFAVAVVGALIPSVFNIVSLLISFFFPRIVIMFRPKVKMPGDGEDAASYGPSDNEDDGGDEEE